jgi:hypothetical protein
LAATCQGKQIVDPFSRRIYAHSTLCPSAVS